MRDLRDVRIRRGLLVLAVVSICMTLAGPVHAKTEKINFLPGTDTSSWYWERQQDQEVTTPPGVTLPPPIPPVSQRVRGPHPYRPDTLPVTQTQGQQERKSAVKFDLYERGVIEGSKIKKLLLFIEESPQGEREPPQVRPELAKIQACRIIEFLTQGENEQSKDAPKIDDKDCVDGTREVVTGAAAVWTFDLTKMADAWAKNPFENYGVMLQGTGSDSWEVHLKVPRKDTPAEEGDQYEQTKNRAFISIDYIPGEPPEIPDIAAPPAPTSTGTSTVPSSSGFSPSGSPVIPPSTDFAGGDIPGAETTPAVPAPTEQAGFLVPPETGPRMPAYVWLAIPLALLALSAVRSVVLEPVGGPRPDGVISSIRRRNAERRGGAITARTGALARFTGGLKSSIGGGFSSLTRSLRRKR